MTTDAVVARYRTAGVLVDSNLLLLHFVGRFDAAQIQGFKRTMHFTPQDHWVLQRFLGGFERLVTTPHVLAETSNLAAQLSGAVRERLFGSIAAEVPHLDERTAPASDLAADPAFSAFGVTDTAILHLAQGRHLVLTDDFRLSQYLSHRGVDALNFHHVRSYLL